MLSKGIAQTRAKALSSYRSLSQFSPQSFYDVQSWKRRWFVLSRTDPINPGAVELSYYTDPMKQEKKRSFPLSRVVKIHPTFSKAKDHSFAVELPEHKFLLRAPDGNSKNVWVAKLCEFSGQGQWRVCVFVFVYCVQVCKCALHTHKSLSSTCASS